MTKVIKRDGTPEEFETAKIVRVLVAAGLNAKDSETVAQHVSEWVTSSGQESIKSTDLASKVTEKLRKINPYIADLYDWYEKTKLTVQNSSK